MSKCKYLSDNGICKVTSDGEVSEPCIMGPCGKETTAAPRFSEEEREALGLLCRYISYEKNSMEKKMCEFSIGKAIATVRAMLQEVTEHD